MSLGPLELAAVLGLPLVLGAAVLRASGVRSAGDGLAWTAWAIVAGGLATAALLFLWCWTPIPLDARWIAPALAALALALLGLGRTAGRRSGATVAERALSRDAPWERALFAAAVALAIAALADRMLLATLHPLVDGDETHLWALKAKLLFHAGGFGEAFREATSDRTFVLHADYPLLDPLLQLWAFVHAGEILHVANRLPVQAFAIALVLVVASAARRRLRPALAAALVVSLFGLRELGILAAQAGADLVVAAGAAIALDAWLRRSEEPDGPWGAIAAIGLATMVWAKNEGLLYLAAVLVALLVERARPTGARRPRLAALPLALPLAVAAATWTVNARYGFSNDLITGDHADSSILARFGSHLPERGLPVLAWLARHVLLAPSHGSLALLLLLAFVAVLPRRVAASPLRAPAIALLLAFAGHWAVYVSTPHDPLAWHLPTSAERVTFQLVPALHVWVAAAAGRWLPGAAPRGAG